jgi:AcrR family transcriptional regulator
MTRQSIQDAALDLFVEKGYDATTVEEIADRAVVSKGTFFRYFANKGDVLYGKDGHDLEELRRAIVSRPSDETDVVATVRALRDDFLLLLDPERVLRQSRASATSPLLRGLSYDLAIRCQDAISHALAERHGLRRPNDQSRMVAAVVFAAYLRAVHVWVHEKGGRGALSAVVDNAFDSLTQVFSQGSAAPSPE